MAYTAYVLEEEQRAFLLDVLFLPQNPKVIAHHVTVQFGVPSHTPPPDEAIVRAVGIMRVDGLEAIVCSVNGDVIRPDDSIYHITWSLDPDRFKPVDSNRIIREHGWKSLPVAFELLTVPSVLG